MSIKILGGFARGQLLDVPKGDLIRPTSVMLRRRIFDYFQTLDDVVFVDLCAGSGAMGFEAWSRGASKVYLNEVSKAVIRILEENRESILLRNHHKKTGEIICSHHPAERWLKTFRSQYETFSDEQKSETIIFVDPPYSEKSVYEEIIRQLTAESWFFGQLWIESDPLKGIPKERWAEKGLHCAKLFEQGDNYIYVTNFPQSN